MTTSSIRSLVRPALFVAILGCAFAAGCNIIVPAAYMIEGPPSKDAEFTLPEKKVVVFVDDIKNNLPRSSLRTRMGDKVAELLLERGVVKDAIASRDAMQVARKRDTDKTKLAISEVGQEIGAEMIIYIKINDFRITPDGATPRPVASAEVKVLDVGGARRLYPEMTDGNAGRSIQSMTREADPEMYKSSAGRRKLEDALADSLAAEAAKLFYKHEIKELGGSLGVH